jgi:outer membrane protein assembly factor BamB
MPDRFRAQSAASGTGPWNTYDQPWSPFPVQDWSTLPPDPLGSVAINPTWPEPKDPRPWWRPLLIIGLVAVLIAGAALVANSVGATLGTTAAADYLPPDGAVSYERTVTTRELKTTVGTAVTEAARLSGVSGLLSTDGAFANKILNQAYTDYASIQILRTTTTAINDPTAIAQTIRFYRVNTGVELMALSGQSEGYVYSPALLLLPAEVTAGQQWSGAGSASDTLDYRSQLRADALDNDCLRVTGEVRYLSKSGQLGRVVTVAQTWCRDQGMLSESQSFADIRTDTSHIDPPVPTPVTTTNGPIRWTAPQHWTAKNLGTISFNPTFGEGPMLGSPSAVTPVRTESGLVIRATAGQGDLVATTPKTPTAWTSIWRAHPGGTIMTLSAFGNVIIATTSNREVVAYSDVGVRLWQLPLDDLAPTAPARIEDHDAVLVDLSGEVRRFDLATGTVWWQRETGADVNVAPVVGSGFIVIMDRGGTTTAFDANTGEPRWSKEMQGSAASIRGDTVVVIQDQTAHALAMVSGRHRWVHPIFGTLTDMQSFADHVVVATKSESVMLNGSGAVLKRLGPVLTLTPSQDHLLAWGPTEASVISRDGAVLARWELPALTLSQQERPALAIEQGALLFSNDWTFQARDNAG